MIDTQIALQKTDAQHIDAPSKNREAAEKFEALFVGMMLKQARESMDSSMFSGEYTEMFADIWDQSIAEEMRQGGGLGLADQLEKQLDAMGKSVPSPQAASFLPRQPAHGADFSMPVEGGRISSGYGKRIDPFHGREKNHHGLDIAAPEGSPIRAVQAGVVTYAGERGGYGNVVILRHVDGTETRYAHCASVAVEAGQTIPTGDTLGTVGSTGRSTGPHLHFEVRKDGKILDPAQWLSDNKKITQHPRNMIRGDS